MPFWSRLFRALTSLSPRFKRDFGEDAARDYSTLVAHEERTRGRLASAWIAWLGAVDALKASIADRASDAPGFRSLGPDIRQALRMYRREPLLTLAIAATLAIGIGATTAAFSVVHAILIQDLPIRHEDRLVVLYGTTPRTQEMYGSYADVQDFRAQMQTAEWVGGARRSSATWMAAHDTLPLSVVRLTDGFLTELGVRFLAGRDFAESEATAAVASRRFAEQYFGSAEAAVGQTLTLDDGAAEIVGVLADPLELPSTGLTQLFRPYALSPTEIAARGSNAVLIIVRLRDGVGIQEAEAEAMLIQKRLAEIHPRERENDVRLTPLRPEIVGSVEGPLRAIFLAVAAVLAIALASVVSLLLARAASRAGDVAVRLSLGATRARLSRLWLIESLALAVPGGLAGIGLAYALVAIYRSALPRAFGRLNIIEIDRAGLIGAAVLMVVSAAAFSLAPRLLGLGRVQYVGIKDASRSIAGLRRARWQSGLIAGQIALSLVLVCCAIWLAASLARLRATPLGFDPDGVVSAQFSLSPALRMNAEARTLLVRQLTDEIGALGWVEAVAISDGLPGGLTSRFGLRRIRPGDPPFGPADDSSVVRFVVSPSFFSLLRIPLVRGRVFDESDRAAPLRSVVVSQSFARRYLPDGDVGTGVALSGQETQTVIGVVADVHADALGRSSEPQMYFVEGAPGVPSALAVRAKTGASISPEDLKGIFRRVAPDIIVRILPMRERVALALESRRLATLSAHAFAAIALLLAAINVYGLATLTVVQRRREIGIRMALGAAAREAVTLVVRRGAVWIGAGVVAGLSAAVLLAAPAIRSQLVQTSTGEPLLIAAGTVIVCASALVALWIPARHAATVDPATILRSE
ncbi:MAG TPA: ABC transporter permease [Vicinamibacterales bacterium]|nr:ABC transporter permease [Vicinamibacterales bacterium]